VRRSLKFARAERRSRPDDVLPPTPVLAVPAEARPSLARALALLARDGAAIEAAWRRLLRGLKPGRDEYDALATLQPGACFRLLSTSRDADRAAVEARARALMRAGVPEGYAMAAVTLYLEACLASLARASDMAALVRLTAGVQRLVAAGYAEERAAGLRRLDDRERQRLASDLHDEVGADLVVLKLQVEMIAHELSQGGAPAAAPKLAEALALISHAMESVRRLTLDLGPASLEKLGFVPALRHFVRQFSARTGIDVAFVEPRGALRLPAAHETALYRVLRGALSNVAKHSGARHVTVVLERGDAELTMSVEDDGRGFDPGTLSVERSFGLAAMRDRVRELRGRFAIESRPARRPGQRAGTRLLVRLPLERRAA
jgi:signal transduction histidine kinase